MMELTTVGSITYTIILMWEVQTHVFINFNLYLFWTEQSGHQSYVSVCERVDVKFFIGFFLL